MEEPEHVALEVALEGPLRANEGPGLGLPACPPGEASKAGPGGARHVVAPGMLALDRRCWSRALWVANCRPQPQDANMMLIDDSAGCAEKGQGGLGERYSCEGRMDE